MDDQAWLITLDMLPVSDVIYAIPNTNNKWNSTIDWIFFDIYKIAPNFPLEISIFAFIYNSNAVEIDEYDCPWKWAWQRVSVTPKFQSKSTRDDLKGLQLRCGLVVGAQCLLRSVEVFRFLIPHFFCDFLEFFDFMTIGES